MAGGVRPELQAKLAGDEVGFAPPSTVPLTVRETAVFASARRTSPSEAAGPATNIVPPSPGPGVAPAVRVSRTSTGILQPAEGEPTPAPESAPAEAAAPISTPTDPPLRSEALISAAATPEPASPEPTPEQPRPQGAAKADAPATKPDQPPPSPPPTPVAPARPEPLAGPAGQVFAVERHRSEVEERRGVRDDLSAPTLAATAAANAPAVAPTAESREAPLDLAHAHWPRAMVERIERMRDEADLASTRITLRPDALGSIDVSVRAQGDRLHVHFAAEQATTRQLLADAAPRLAEAAEARGLRLGQTSVDTGQTGGGSDRRAPPPPPAPSAPPRARARAPAAAEGAPDTQTRIA